LLTADSWTSLVHVSHDSDETLFTPAVAPGVLDDPVIGIACGTLTNKENTVIKIGTAASLNDITRVELPGEGVGIDGNGNWTL